MGEGVDGLVKTPHERKVGNVWGQGSVWQYFRRVVKAGYLMGRINFEFPPFWCPYKCAKFVYLISSMTFIPISPPHISSKENRKKTQIKKIETGRHVEMSIITKDTIPMT